MARKLPWPALAIIGFVLLLLVGLVLNLAGVLHFTSPWVETPNDGPAIGKGHFTQGAADVPPGEFLLIRKGDRYGAIRFTKSISRGDGGYVYEWFYSDDKSGEFTGPTARSGSGVVFEDYQRTPDPDDPKNQKLVDAGGQLELVCGELRAEWSLRTWVYFRSFTGGSLDAMAFSGTGDIDEVDYLSNDLLWHERKD